MKKDGQMMPPLHHVDLATNLILILLSYMIINLSIIFSSHKSTLLEFLNYHSSFVFIISGK